MSRADGPNPRQSHSVLDSDFPDNETTSDHKPVELNATGNDQEDAQ